MDYLDPRKRMRHTIILYTGYVLIGIAIVIATTVLLYQAYGFGIDRKGKVIQNGLVFISSQPAPADIYVSGHLEGSQTNTRLSLPEATYDVQLRRAGYTPWQRSVIVEGGKVLHIDYPLLTPVNLNSTKLFNFVKAPSFSSQSPDKRWLITGRSETQDLFDLFDLKNPTKAPSQLSLPANLLTPAAGPTDLSAIEWADDNQHILLKHSFAGKLEYILLDRQNPSQSVNLNTSIAPNLGQLSLIDRKYDKYYSYDPAGLTLSKASLKAPGTTVVLSGVIAFKPYGNDVILYATSIGASSGKTRIQLKVNDQSYTIRSVAADGNYLLDITTFNNTFYVVAGASSENRLYVYEDPAGQIGNNLFRSPVPTQVLRVTAPNFVSFSSNTQYIMAENGSQFSVFDIQNKRGYNFTSKVALDTPQTHASWLDGNRLTLVSGGKQVFVDYDNQNLRTLGAASPNYTLSVASDIRYTYTIVKLPDGQAYLNQTALRIPSEL